MATRYVFFRDDHKQDYFEFDPRDPTCLDAVGYRYYGRVFNLLHEHLETLNLTIYATGWTVKSLPSYGPHVLAFILQDEWSREARYREKVRAIFRTCGRFPLSWEAYKGAFIENCATGLGQFKAFSKDGPGRIQTLIKRIAGRNLAPVYDLPIGYYVADYVPPKPIAERTFDLFFAGSVQHKKGRRVWGPKEFARARMIDALRSLKRQEPALNIQETLTEGFAQSVTHLNSLYVQSLANAKFCPIPRGANLETYRYYEVLRHGAIPVGEVFPELPYYKGAPLLHLNRWCDLQTLIPALLKDRDRMQDMQREVLDWWTQKCSEEATAQHILSKLRTG